MNYIIREKTDDFDELGKRHISYGKYLARNKGRFLKSKMDCLFADWYFDWSDRRCFHDSWLQKIVIDRSENFNLQIYLLGAYHDRQIILSYDGVTSYDMPDVQSGNWEWDIDEVEVTECGSIKHKILWTSGVKWELCFNGDFKYADKVD